MFDNSYTWIEKEAVRLAYAKMGNKANEKLMKLRVARVNRLIDEPCVIVKKRWFRKNILRCMPLAEAQASWVTRTENSHYDKEFTYLSGFDVHPRSSERRGLENRIAWCENNLSILEAIKKEEIFISLEEVERIKEYL